MPIHLKTAEKGHQMVALDYSADAYVAGNTRVVPIHDCAQVNFQVLILTSATGTPRIKVQACDDLVPTNTADVKFRYCRIRPIGRRIHPVAVAAASTFDVTASEANQLYVVSVLEGDARAAGEGAATPFHAVGVRLNIQEPVNAALAGTVIANRIDLLHETVDLYQTYAADEVGPPNWAATGMTGSLPVT